ncbi:Ig-like domain-containing protein [Shewanella sp. MBTL60-007]|uniref:Ig-like domain-containing protein n=1 Tax=Shewanella sp. MBTL60-007 TaxID=2815911 RepID=UPI001BC7AAFA|nr:Ig-like domain-containing protein [Shewanella sp. MBTL60-007]GIU22542.1 hypothetical protein TUM3792_24820 [Shewanella sp. MBTL60-007]
MMNNLTACYKRVLLASMATLLVACGSDNDDAVTPPTSDNNPPVAQPTTATAIVGTPVMVDAIANDTDPDGDALTLTVVELTEGSGTGVIKDNQLLFTPEQPGTVVFSYTVADPQGATDDSTVTIKVSAATETGHFVGTQTCLTCHTDKATFLETGHNFKLSKIENGEAPQFPFSSLEGSVELLYGADNSAGTPNSWDEVSYVIGGYYRTAMYLDSNGYILSGTGVRAILPENGEDFTIDHISGYAPGGEPDSHPFDCGHCHTTGWKDYTPDSPLNPNHQDGLEGIEGTFEMTGIQCEACHGAGSKHIQSQSADDIDRIAKGRYTSDLLQADMAFGKAITCAECHSKKTNRKFPTFISEHNQDFGGDSIGGRTIPYDIGGRVAGDALLGMDANTGEITGKKHDMACHTCHNPHQSKINDDQPGHENAMVKQCVDCHYDKPFTPELEVHSFVAKCETCHMPKDKHFFRINLDYPASSPENFSKDGKYVQPWNTSKDSCSGCHKVDYDERAALIKKMHQ